MSSDKIRLIRQVWSAAVAFGVFLGLASLCPADVFYLTDGGTVEGRLVGDTGDAYVIDIGMGRMTIPKSDVSSIHKKTFEVKLPPLEPLEETKPKPEPGQAVAPEQEETTPSEVPTPPGELPEPTEKLAQCDLAPMRFWMKVIDLKQPEAGVGYIFTAVRKMPGGYYGMESKSAVLTSYHKLRSMSADTTVLDDHLVPVRFSSTFTTRQDSLSRQGMVKEGKLTLDVQEDGKTSKEVLPLPAGRLEASAALFRFLKEGGLRQGLLKSYPAFDLAELKPAVVAFQVRAEQELKIGRVKLPCWAVEQSTYLAGLPPRTVKLYVQEPSEKYPGGLILRVESPEEQMRYQRSTEEAARSSTDNWIRELGLTPP